MFQQIFNPNNFFFRWCGKIFDTVLLSVLWIFLCLPVVTMGPATAALYYTSVKCLRRDEGEPYRNFFHAFKENFKVGAISGVIVAALLGVLWLSWRVLTLSELTAAGTVVRVAFRVALVVPLGLVCWLFPVLSRFTLGVGGLFRTALALAIKHLPSTILLVLLNALAVVFCLNYWLPVAFVPVLSALMSSLLLERVFKKYIAPPAVAEAKEEEALPSMGERPEEEPEEEKPWYLK